MTTVTIINSGGANIASLTFALKRLGITCQLTLDPDEIRAAERVILPGVGAAADAMSRLREAGLVDVIRALKQPVLGVCLGMQLLFEGSDEDGAECLGVIPGSANKLPARPEKPVPNMGWCQTRINQPHPLLEGIADNDYFYYLHSYALSPSNVTVATATHDEAFSAIVAHKNFVATQFHPERSSSSGARLLSNFIAVSTCA